MTHPHLTHLDPDQFRRTPWKNGGGMSLDIAGAHSTGGLEDGYDGMLWRFGRTSILQPGPFSDLTGYDRLQLVLNGAGLVLETPEGEIDLRQPLQPVRYDGGTPIVTRLEHGPVEVINLIADRERCDIDLSVLKPGAGLETRPGATTLLYAPDAPCELRAVGQRLYLATGHAVKLDGSTSFPIVVETGMIIAASVLQRTHLL
jgi:environmental stress-induced protein Ves